MCKIVHTFSRVKHTQPLTTPTPVKHCNVFQGWISWRRTISSYRRPTHTMVYKRIKTLSCVMYSLLITWQNNFNRLEYQSMLQTQVWLHLTKKRKNKLIACSFAHFEMAGWSTGRVYTSLHCKQSHVGDLTFSTSQNFDL